MMFENYDMKVISQEMNSNDYYVTIRVNYAHMFWKERQIDLTLIGILDKCYE